MINLLITIIGVLALICLWVLLYDSNRFVVARYRMEDARIKKSCRFVVLADLHNKQYGRNNERLLAAIKECKPDFILVAGDMLTAKPGKSPEAALHFLEALAALYPVYYGNGNHEHRLKLYPSKYGDLGEQYEKALRKMGICLLVNEHVSLPEAGVVIYGSQIDKQYYKRFRVQKMEGDYLESILGRIDRAGYNILIAHNPDYFPQYAEWGADLVLSGHVHGGMVRIPFWGKGVVSPGIRLFPKYDGGLFRQGDSSMLLSRGLGMHTIPIRLFNPAEVLVVDLVPSGGKKTDAGRTDYGDTGKTGSV